MTKVGKKAGRVEQEPYYTEVWALGGAGQWEWEQNMRVRAMGKPRKFWNREMA